VPAVAPPIVTSVSPPSGPTGGGTTVTITGSGLQGTTAVSFGAATTSFVVESDGSVQALAPRHNVGTVDIRLTTSGGTSDASARDHYTYTG
jgi:hypothetical protein